MKIIIFSIILFFGCSITLGQNNKDSLALEKVREPFYKRSELLRTHMIKNDSLIRNSIDSQIFFLKKRSDSLSVLWDENYKALIESELDYVMKHPHSAYSPEILKNQVTKQSALGLYEKFWTAYNQLSSQNKKSKDGLEFIQKYTALMNTSPGRSVPDIKMQDINGKIFDIRTDAQNRYVLIDFWASWCKPCLEDFPYLKKIYEEYRNQGLLIVSISRDESLSSWKKMIEKKEIQNFIHLSTKENQSKIEKDFAITGIPVKFLIDTNGKIIKKWRGGGNENLEEIESILESLLTKQSEQ